MKKYQDNSQDLLIKASKLLKDGNLAEVEEICDILLNLEPCNPEILYLSALVAHNMKLPEIAENRIIAAINYKHGEYSYYYLLGNIQKSQKKAESAIESYKKSIALKKNFIPAYFNLGRLYYDLKIFNNAHKVFLDILKISPAHIDTFFYLGLILQEQKKYDEALSYFEKIISIKPHAQAYGNIGIILHEKNQYDSAYQNYLKVLELEPRSYEALNNLGYVCNELKRYEEALFYYKTAYQDQPENVDIINNIATTFKNQGKMDEAVSYFKKALSINPHNAKVFSNLLLTMIYMDSIHPKELALSAMKFGKQIADPLFKNEPFANKCDMYKKLRIGYVSADLRNHPVRFFFEFLLNLHHTEFFEIFIYSSTPGTDGFTRRMQNAKCIQCWHDVKSFSDQNLYDLIKEDSIDILVDVSGHTAGNRLLTFAMKPAPIQISWLGFPATTGIKSFDYRITDPYVEPIGMTEHLNIEELWRLPDVFCCYSPDTENSPSVNEAPFMENGYITFGCFNNFSKVTDKTLSCWKDILNNTENSKLLLEIDGVQDPELQKHIKNRLEKTGISLERITLEPRKKSNQFVLYNKIDIALDPFPCNGGTTSMDTLWMGVPLITLAGRHFVSRMGVSVLTNAGLPELIAHTTDEYVDIAVSLANDKERLKNMRRNLREKFAASPWMDQEKFTRNLENAYRQMWRIWCEKQTN